MSGQFNMPSNQIWLFFQMFASNMYQNKQFKIW